MIAGVCKNEKTWIWTGRVTSQQLVSAQQQIWHQQRSWATIPVTKWSFSIYTHRNTSFGRTLQRNFTDFGVNTPTGHWTKNPRTISILQHMFMRRMSKRVWSACQQKRSNPHITKVFPNQTTSSSTSWASWINVHYTPSNFAWSFSRTWWTDNYRKHWTNMEKRNNTIIKRKTKQKLNVTQFFWFM